MAIQLLLHQVHRKQDFGRTGTVDWQTTIKTSNFYCSNGEGYFCNTSGGAFTITLTCRISAGDIVGFKDYNNTFDSNNLTIGRNGSEKMDGVAGDLLILTIRRSCNILVYVDATVGWVAKQDDSSTGTGQNFIEATGGDNCYLW